MKFLIDECTGPAVARWFENWGFDVYSVFEKNRGVSDRIIIEFAFLKGYIIVTNDKDFGELIIRQGFSHHGLILLRLEDERSVNKIRVLSDILANHLDKIENNIVIATDDSLRIVKP